MNYMGMDGDHAHEDMVIFRQHLSRVRNLVRSTDYTLVGTGAVDHRFRVVHRSHDTEYESTYTTHQKKFIDRFAWKYTMNEIQWLKERKDKK